ncbi:MAG: DNA mismatch repair protein MutS [Candidatus Tectomicrobia bacterium]|uniref:DNA mismatch repair protein MutS n=1 Tax=Tectimicrobiota bacterium TaxID=2528274 RepID=A0A938B1D0_UNCTE|nr:DNA mismatch repair protein MutS [Candidatus Tectomicrobia bacterium]
MVSPADQSFANLTPMLRQYTQAKTAHPDAMVLFRLGDFYEMFDEDARQGARLLELVLTSREIGKGQRVPMCGVPVHAVETYIARLIRAGCKVAVCEQMEDPRLVRGLVRREVVRVITPGTVVEEAMLEEDVPNFLVAICEAETAFGLAALEVSTGEFLATTLEGETAFDALQAELVRLQPAECLVSATWQAHERWQPLAESLRLHCTVCEAQAFDLTATTPQLERYLGAAAPWRMEHTPLALRAAGAIVQYAQATHHMVLPHVTVLRPYRLAHYMVLDAVTRRNLELVRTLRHSDRQGSVLGVLDETTTAMGARLLRRWLEQPLLQLEAITARLDAVAELAADTIRRQQLRQALRPIYDIERLLGRVACGTANTRQLTALRISLEGLAVVRTALEGCQAGLLCTLREACTGEEGIIALLQRALVDEPPPTIRDGGLMRPGYDTTLDELIQETDRHTRWVARLQERERQRTGIKSLKVGYNQVFGYYIEVSKANLSLVPADYIRKQTLTNGERFITESLKEREVAILHASEQRITLEYSLFVALRERIAGQASLLQRLAATVAQLDTLAALAEVAVLYNYVRPRVDDGPGIVIRQGRHPVVERMRDGFVPNDLSLDHEAQQLLVLTGPNMAGKSTYLRQVALIALLAQMGSFVPAAEANIGLVDRIFTRVGAVDDIAAGRSTFLVEMTETAHILHHATARSLVVLDEIGKGTSTFEGLSIAWAVALYVVRRLQARGLFATHFHELTALESLCTGIKNFHMAVRETPEGVVFLRQLVPGGTSKSYGLHVARLAGLPPEILTEATRVLQYLEQHGRDPAASVPLAVNGAQQPPMPPVSESLAQRLLGLDICQITPLQALSILHHLQQQARAGVAAGEGLT